MQTCRNTSFLGYSEVMNFSFVSFSTSSLISFPFLTNFLNTVLGNYTVELSMNSFLLSQSLFFLISFPSQTPFIQPLGNTLCLKYVWSSFSLAFLFFLSQFPFLHKFTLQIHFLLKDILVPMNVSFLSFCFSLSS